MSHEQANNGKPSSAALTTLVGAAHLTVGISPTYWAHVPLSIDQIHNLRVVQGVSCLVEESNGHEKLIPISRCRLTGTIINVERNSASVLYVIDDGTGLIDCLYWLDNDEYELPSLFESTVADRILPVGEMVSILGRLECVAIGVHANGGTVQTTTTTTSGETKDNSSRAIREVHANVVKPLSASSLSAQHRPQTFDAESQHWIKCVSPTALMSNATDVLALLGPEITAQVQNKSDNAVAQDYTGAWQVFGLECRCNLVYKDSLLYCHCQATPEPLDPDFRYRDALLLALLKLETSCTVTDSSNANAHLRFQYKDVSNDEKLNHIALDQVVKSGGPSSNSRRLVLDTFRALRRDGIVFLVDESSDTYLLVSRDRVLEPFVRKMQSTDLKTAQERRELKRDRPGYLAKVPKARLQFIRKELAADKESNELEIESQ